MSSKGPEDKHLYGNPKMTYFKNVFVKSRNFVIEYSKIPKTESYEDFDGTFRVKILNQEIYWQVYTLILN